ncbi:MAG: HD domain-containing protein [Acidobacteria bacterium]|nr:HD domain-containing protein [Acidobacteriota bacterium]
MAKRIYDDRNAQDPQRFILCVHGDRSVLEDLRIDLEAIAPSEYRILPVDSPTRGLEIIHDLESQGDQVDIVISDMGASDFPGYRFLEIVNQRFPHVRKILLTSGDEDDAAVYSINTSDLDRCLRQPVSKEDFRLTIESLLRLCRLRADNEDLLVALRGRNVQLLEMLGSLRQAHTEIEQSYLQTIQALAKALDAKDAYTAGHSGRVSRFAYLLARRMGLSREKCEDVRDGALMHDIGKIGVPEAVLLKPGRMTEDEIKLMQRHPVIGAQILEPVEPLRRYIPSVKYHHERWDGKGYPDGLKAEKIPVEARITLIADTFDAITSDRPYRSAKPLDLAIDQFSKFAGMQFDPECVRVFLEILKEDPPGLACKAEA